LIVVARLDRATQYSRAVAVKHAGAAFGQDVRYNFDKNADFSKFKTYKWVSIKDAPKVNDLTEKQIIAAVDAELAAKGLTPFRAQEHPETLATAIKIGDPVSWPKAQFEIETTNGVVERASEQEIADAKAVVGQCGIGCEPASAATLAGIRKLTAAGVIARNADVIAVLTGNVLKDPDYIFRYHTNQLQGPDGAPIVATFGNKPVVAPNDADRITELIG